MKTSLMLIRIPLNNMDVRHDRRDARDPCHIVAQYWPPRQRWRQLICTLDSDNPSI